MTGSFARALEKRDETVEAVDPRTGMVLRLAEAEHDELVDAYVALQERERKIKEWRMAVEDELVRRHGDNKGAQSVGNYTVDVERTTTRAWDIDDLTFAIDELVDQGLVDPRDVEGLVREKREIDGIKAKKLIDHADGDVLLELSRCFTWKKGRAKVRVTPVAELEA